MPCTKAKVFFYLHHVILLAMILSGIGTTVGSLYAEKWDNYDYTYKAFNFQQRMQFHQNLWGYHISPKINNILFDMGHLKEDYKEPIRNKMTGAAVMASMALLLELVHFSSESSLQNTLLPMCLLLLVQTCMTTLAAGLLILSSIAFKEHHMENLFNTVAYQYAHNGKDYKVDKLFLLDSGYFMCLAAATLLSAVGAFLLSKIAVLLVVKIRNRVSTRSTTPVQNLVNSPKKKNPKMNTKSIKRSTNVKPQNPKIKNTKK